MTQSFLTSEPRAATNHPRSTLVHVVAIGLLVGTLALKVARASFEGTIWMDEVFSLELSTKSGDVLWDLSKQDLHPPLYYWLLGFWNELPARAGLSNSILWARLLNIVVWLAAAALSWTLLRGIFRDWRAIWGVMVIALSPNFVQLTQDARGYGLASFGILLCYLLLARTYVNLDVEKSQASRASALFSILAAIAAWSHLLSWVLIALLCLLWATYWYQRRQHGSAVLYFSILTLALAILPWAIHIPQQLEQLSTSAPGWMTPPTGANLFRVFWIWIPLGRDGEAILAHYPAAWVLVAAMPACILLSWILIRRVQDKEDRTAAFRLFGFGVLGLGIAALFSIGLWVLNRYLGISVFHGPRYPALGIGPWITGSLLVILASTERCASPKRTILLSAPWVATSLLALAMSTVGETRSAKGFKKSFETVTAGTTQLFVLPDELAPYFRSSLSGHSVRSFEAAICGPPISGAFKVLSLNRWRGIDTPTSLALHTALNFGFFGTFQRTPFPQSGHDFELFELSGNSTPENQVEVCAAVRELRSPVTSSDRSQVARIADQFLSDGWSYVEFNRRLQLQRWTSKRNAALRFSTSVPPGPYALRLSVRMGQSGRLRVAIPSASTAMEFELSDRAEEVTMPFVASGSLRRLTIVLSVENLRAVQVGAGENSYERLLGVQVLDAQIAPIQD